VQVDIDQDKTTAERFKVRAIPDTRVLDGDGNELLKVLGNRPEFMDQMRSLDAVATVERAMKENPGSVAAMLDAADVYMKVGRIEDAGKALEQALGADPDDKEGRRAETWYKLGVANARGGRAEQAEAAWIELGKVDPENKKGFIDDMQFARCQNAVDDEDFPTAIKGLEEFLARYPQSEHVPDAKYLLGASLFQSFEYEKSLSTFRDVERAHPDSAAAKKAAEAAKKVEKKMRR
jgi:TolA-binding protein